MTEAPGSQRALDGIDELIFLGDLYDFLFGSVGDAVDASDGLLRLIAEKLWGRLLELLSDLNPLRGGIGLPSG